MEEIEIKKSSSFDFKSSVTNHIVVCYHHIKDDIKDENREKGYLTYTTMHINQLYEWISANPNQVIMFIFSYIDDLLPRKCLLTNDVIKGETNIIFDFNTRLETQQKL